MSPFVQKLGDAAGFVDVAVAVCAHARDRRLDSQVVLVSSTGVPLVTVESIAWTARTFCEQAPITALAQTIGVIHWGSDEPLTPLQSELAAVALHVSVRMAQLGHVSCVDELDALTPRQLEAASLAARGYSNVEIAEHLGVSMNTIKKHLGEVFFRLHIANRTELALRFSRLTALERLAPGTSYIDGYRIVCNRGALER